MVPRKILWLSVVLDGGDSYTLLALKSQQFYSPKWLDNYNKYLNYYIIKFYII